MVFPPLTSTICGEISSEKRRKRGKQHTIKREGVKDEEEKKIKMENNG